MDRPRVAALDGLRGLAVLGVLFTHHGLTLDDSPPARLFGSLAGAGSTGVDLFFVLSGYLITGLLLDARGHAGYFRTFYWRRVLRILPVAWGVLAGLLLVMPPVVRGQEWTYWTFLSNWTQGLAGEPPGYGFSLYWSLAIEEQFYLVWPALVLWLPRRWLLRLLTALIVGPPIARLIATLFGVPTFTIYVLTPFRLDALALGALVAAVGPRHLTRLAPKVLALAGVPLLAVWLAVGELPLKAAWFQWWGYSLIPAVYAGLLVLAVTRARFGRLLAARGLRLFGTYSYCLYLIHDPLRLPLDAVLPSSTPAPLRFGLWLLLALALSALSWRYVERPILSLKRFVPYAAHGAAQSQSPSGRTVSVLSSAPTL